MAKSFRGRRALITGASSGIGADLARQLAQRGANVVLVARRADRLEALAAECALFGVTAEAVPADLTDEAARIDLATRFPDIDILVNNAGVGVFGTFAKADWKRTEQVVTLNIVALTHLTHLFAPLMAARGWGRVLLVGSTAAFRPVPLYAVYAATKSYVLSLGAALNVELAKSGVKVTVLCPGVTETEFFDVASQKRSMFVERTAMTSAEVARIGLAGLEQGRATVISGTFNAAMAFGTRFAPRGLAAQIAHRMFKR